MNQDIKSLLFALNQKPIAYHKAYTQITGRLTAGVMLSQLMYWYSVVGGREFYKTDEELSEETGLSNDELKSAKKILVSKGFITHRLKGIPAKTHYTINLDKLINQLTSLCKTHEQVSGNSTNCVVEIPPTITENTQKNTTEKREKKNSSSSKNQIFYERIMKTYNQLVGREAVKSSSLWSSNVDYWLTEYTEKDIIRAVWHLLLIDNVWEPLKDLKIFFRRRNSAGNVDHIGEMLIKEVPKPDSFRGKSVDSNRYGAILDYYQIFGD